MVNIPGMTVELTKAIGRITICMVRESTSGQMGVNTKENISTTKNTDMEFTPTQMADLTKVTGQTENNMGKVPS